MGLFARIFGVIHGLVGAAEGFLHAFRAGIKGFPPDGNAHHGLVAPDMSLVPRVKFGVQLMVKLFPYPPPVYYARFLFLF
mgnify:CR=1 FL=1